MPNMRRTIIFHLLLVLFLGVGSPARAFWVWTPETNKWVNPKYAVKGTPEEQLHYALEFYEAKEYKMAVREFNKLVKNYPQSKEAPEAQYYLGRVLEDQGKLYEAFKAYQTVIDMYPFSELAAEIVQREYDIGVKLLEGEKDRSKFVDVFVGADYTIIEVFEKVIKNSPYGKLAPVAQYKIGLYLLERRLYQDARDAFEKVMNDYPESEWAKAAKFQIAISDAERSAAAPYDQKVTQAAVEEFKDFTKMYPDADLSQDAKEQIQQLREKEAENHFLVAQYYEKRKDYKAAKIYYQIVVDEYRNSSWFSGALEKTREMNQKEKE